MSHFIGVSGVPTILFGPGDMALAHQADERVPVEELHAATRVLAATAAGWCG
jgi:acetylornithine deacetylase